MKNLNLNSVYYIKMLTLKSGIFILLGLLFSNMLYAETFPIYTFKEKVDKEIGKLYLEFTENNVIKTAKIKHQGKLLYTIDEKGFSNEQGIQMMCSCDPFYGYMISGLTKRSISVVMSDKNGRGVSDVATIMWDVENQKFSFMFSP